MGLVRKKVKVRSKKGKTYMRSVMVTAGEKVKSAARAVGRGVHRATTGKTATGTGFKMGVLTGVAQYVAEHHAINRAYKHGLGVDQINSNAHKAMNIAGNVGAAATFINAHRAGQMNIGFGKRLKLVGAHMGGRVVGQIATNLAHNVKRRYQS